MGRDGRGGSRSHFAAISLNGRSSEPTLLTAPDDDGPNGPSMTVQTVKSLAQCSARSSHPDDGTSSLTNHILKYLPASERTALFGLAERVAVPVGETFAASGDPVTHAYFPNVGVLAYVREMKSGHQLAITAIGREGIVGTGRLVGISRHDCRIVALLDSEGYRVPSEALCRAFDRSECFRAAALGHIGRHLLEVATRAACSRVHSHRQRLAWWLLTIMDKAHQSSLHVTHDMLAQVVGGPRHAVTVALSELRAKRVIAHRRGRIDILDRSRLVYDACECGRFVETNAPSSSSVDIQDLANMDA